MNIRLSSPIHRAFSAGGSPSVSLKKQEQPAPQFSGQRTDAKIGALLLGVMAFLFGLNGLSRREAPPAASAPAPTMKTETLKESKAPHLERIPPAVDFPG